MQRTIIKSNIVLGWGFFPLSYNNYYIYGDLFAFTNRNVS